MSDAWGGSWGTLSSWDVSWGGGTPVAPVADFAGVPLSGNAPLAVAFTDLSTHSPTSWSWMFGDGGISTQQNPAHTYAAAGTYTVVLTASNSAGFGMETKFDYVTVVAVQSAPVLTGLLEGEGGKGGYLIEQPWVGYREAMEVLYPKIGDPFVSAGPPPGDALARDIMKRKRVRAVAACLAMLDDDDVLEALR